MILQWLTSPEWANVVKALLHTLWQGVAIAVLLGFALRRLDNPVARYRCSLTALGGVLLAGMITWAVLNRPAPQPVSTVPMPSTQTASAPLMPNNLPPLVVNFSPPESKPVALPWSAWLAMFWLAGATAMILRGGFQVAGAERLRRSSRPLVDARMGELLDNARRAVGLTRRVRIAVTDKLTSPAVVGVLMPTLILPLSLTTTLTPEQIRFVLLHELAHIRRGDYLASLFQLFAEALLFFNPAVWWISRQMRIEREACCDTLAIELSGAPVDYARTLVCVAEKVLSPAPAASMAFGDQREPSSLADRVQRMLVPGYRPALRLTWRAMLVALFVGGGLLFLSALGTRVTVAAILTPQERIERIEKKMTELGESPVLNLTYAEAEKAPKVEVSGRVRMADGSPLPKHLYVYAVSIVKGSSYGTGFYLKTNGTFQNSIQPGQIIVSTEIPNYAPAQIGPFLCVGTNKLENLELVISPGFNAMIQLVDVLSGQPLPGATLNARFWLRGGSQTSFRETSLTTDVNGAATLPHATDLPLVVTVNTPGYEILDVKFPSVAAGQPLRVTLQPGTTASGMVLDKATSQPIRDAVVRMITEVGPTSGGYDWDSGQRILARSDAQGRFTINQFRADTVYRLSVNAPGRETVVLDQVRSGNNPLIARLGPELIVQGRVTGNLQRLEAAWGKPDQKELAYSFEDETEGHRQSWGKRTLVRITNGVGYFQFTNRNAGSVKLHVPGETVERRVTEPVNDWAVEIKASVPDPVVPPPQREVVFRFQHPSGVPPRGTVAVTIPDSLTKNRLTAHIQEMPITNGEVRVPIAIGGRTALEPRRMVGYWFNRAGDRGSLLSIEVTNGNGPLVIEIPLIAAGAIYAQARNTDGTQAAGLGFGVRELKKAPGRDDSSSLDSGGDSYDNNTPRQWVSGPLPLGGTYQIHAWRGNAFCVSQPIKLSEANPDAEVVLQFPPGKTFDGVVLDAAGNPLRDVELKASFTLPGNHGFSLKSVFTDERGRFHLENLTPDVGEYFVEVNAPGMMTERVKLKLGSSPQSIRLQRGRTLAGRVVQAGTGYPIPGMEVRALDYDSNRLPMQTTHTDAEGRFEFTSLGDANYTLYPDGGELLGRPASGNLKFRADGRTNLTLTVKLYEWSKLKPKAPDAASGATNAHSSILGDPNYRQEVLALEQRSGIESPAELEEATTNGRGENRTTLPNPSVALSNAYLNGSGRQSTSFSYEGRLSYEGKRLYEQGKFGAATVRLLAALALNPTNQTALFYSNLIAQSRLETPDPARKATESKLERIRIPNFSTGGTSLPLRDVVKNLTELSRANDPEQQGFNFLISSNLDGIAGNGIADVGSVAINFPRLRNIRLADLLDAIVLVAEPRIRCAILEDGSVEFSAKPITPPQLFTRTFQLNPAMLRAALISIRSQHFGSNTNFDSDISTLSLTEIAREFLIGVGFNWQKSPEKSAIYNDQLGALVVTATEEELATIERVIEVLKSTQSSVLSSPANTNSLAGVSPSNQPGAVKGILADPNFRTAIQALSQRSGFEELAEPEVTTMSSGRGINKITLPSISAPLSNFVSATSVQSTTTNSSDAKVEPDKLVRDGKLLYEIGQWDEAAVKLKAALSLDAENAKAKYYLGLVQATSAPPQLVYTSPGRQKIVTMLEQIKFDQFGPLDGLPLHEVVRQLSAQCRLHDPEQKGVNFLIDNNRRENNGIVDPATGLPVHFNTTNTADTGDMLITIREPLTNCTFGAALDALMKAASEPIFYSIRDFAIVFSPGKPVRPLFGRTFKVDTNSIVNAMQRGSSSQTNSLATLAREYLRAHGVDWESPPGKSVFFNDRTGMFYIKATEADLDKIVTILQSPTDKPSAQPAAENANTMTMTFRVDQRIRSEELTNKLLAAGVKIPPTIFFYADNGVFSVRGSKEQLARVNRVVLTLNGYSTNETAAYSASFMQWFTPPIYERQKADEMATNLFMRTFKVDPNVFARALQEQTGLQTNGVSVTAKSFFSQLGVDLESPKGKLVFYANRLGLLFVKATTADLDVIEAALQVLNQVPPQIHIKARFMEVPNGTYKKLVVPNLLTNSLVNNPKLETNVWQGLLSAEKLKTVLKALAANPEVVVKAEPEATTLSGRQTQMRATKTIMVVTKPGGYHVTQDSSVVVSVPDVTIFTNSIETGPILDTVPYVLSDGFTINLALTPSDTEFLGYDKLVLPSIGPLPVGPPLPAVLAKFTLWQAAAAVNLWDGQTVVLDCLPEKSYSLLDGEQHMLKSRASDKELLVFVTATIVDPAGNRVHADDELPFAQKGIPPQPK